MRGTVIIIIMCCPRFIEPVVQRALRSISDDETDEGSVMFPSNYVTRREVQLLEEYLDILLPLKVLIAKLQGEKYITLSTVYPSICTIWRNWTQTHPRTLHTHRRSGHETGPSCVVETKGIQFSGSLQSCQEVLGRSRRQRCSRKNVLLHW